VNATLQAVIFAAIGLAQTPDGRDAIDYVRPPDYVFLYVDSDHVSVDPRTREQADWCSSVGITGFAAVPVWSMPYHIRPDECPAPPIEETRIK